MNCFAKIWQFAVVLSLFVTPLVWAKITIYMCGDSTMQDWYESAYPKQGMGQDFGYFFNADVEVYNAGRGGTTSQTYYEGHWLNNFVKNGVTYPAVSGLLKSGDYVFIMFGANDNGYKTGEANFRNSIGGMVTDARAKGAYPILLSPIRRSSFVGADSVYESYHAYPIFMRRVADSLNVPLIDLDTLSRNYLISVGEYYSHHYVNMFIDEGEYSTSGVQSDNQHLQQMGANSMARIVTEQIRVHKDANVKKLANYLAPMYQVNVNVSPAGSDSATTLSSYYPQGMKVTLKTTPKAGKTFLGWFDANGNKVSGNAVTQIRSDKMYSFVMGNKSTQYTAVYAGGSAVKSPMSGNALTTFPQSTPKCLNNDCSNLNSSSSGSFNPEEEEKMNYDIKKFFDAYEPDSGDGFSENNHVGYTGQGFFNFDNSKNSSAFYQMWFPAAQRVTMSIRYSFKGNSDRLVNIYLDHDYYVSFKSTGSFDVWDTAYVNIDLLSGENTLQFISMTDDGGPNIDAFGFSIEGVCRASDVNCKVQKQDSIQGNSSAKDSSKIAAIRGDVLRLTGTGNALVKVYDMNGRLVKREMVANVSEVPLSSMVKANGIYRVVVKQGVANYSATWAKVK